MSLKNHSFFLILFTIAFLFSLMVIAFTSKGAIVLFFNANQSIYLNNFFIYFTKLAEWQVLVSLLFISLFIKFRYTFLLGLSWLISGICAQFLKKVVFNSERPALYFEKMSVDLNFIENVVIHQHYSFPSGHTTTAFAICSILAFLVKNKFLQLLFFLIAALVGISRVYLLLHFFQDIVAGAFLGLLVSSLVIFVFDKFTVFSKLGEKSLLNMK